MSSKAIKLFRITSMKQNADKKITHIQSQLLHRCKLSPVLIQFEALQTAKIITNVVWPQDILSNFQWVYRLKEYLEHPGFLFRPSTGFINYGSGRQKLPD